MPGSVCPIQVTVRPIHPRAPSAKPDGGAFIHTGKFYERGVIKEMTTKKTSRRALLTSVMALVMCLVMLVGTTFAWFTDSVTSGVNTIKSGNLDVELTYKNSDGEFKTVDKDTLLFNQEALWEPGHVEYVVLTTSNEGSLALKYKLAVNVFGETGSVNMLGDAFQLSSYLKYAVIDGDATTAADFNRDTLTANPGTVLGSYTSDETALYPAGTEGQISSKTVTLAVWMPTTVGNEANHKTGEAAPTIQLGVSLVATQYTAESDSFDDQYDKMAEYPAYPAGVTDVSFDEANGTYYDGLGNKKDDQPAVAAYVDANGEVQYVADLRTAALEGASVIYCKKDADMKARVKDTNRTEPITGDLTIYGNGADFNNGQVNISSVAAANGTVNVKIYDANNLNVWGSPGTNGRTYNVTMKNCSSTKDSSEGLVMWRDGSNSTDRINLVLENCYMKSIGTNALDGIHTTADGTIVVRNSTFVDNSCGVNIAYKASGTLDVTVENCTFTGCGLVASGDGDYRAPVRFTSTGTGTLRVKLSGNTFNSTVGNNGDILLGDYRTGKTSKGFGVDLVTTDPVLVKSSVAAPVPTETGVIQFAGN